MWIRVAIFCLAVPQIFGQVWTHCDPVSDTCRVTVDQAVARVSQVIPSAAYSGTVIWQQIRTLADGTHISAAPTLTKIWRDSLGRTRSDLERTAGFESAEKGRFTLTEIHDPVKGVFYVFDDGAKIAFRFPMKVGPAPKLEVPPEISLSTVMTEKLGSRNIEGVMAEGSRETRTIPTGAIGNDRQIVHTSESWYSAELKRPILTTGSDPREGERTARMVNITRVEPEASVFQPPAGYAVVDGHGSVTVTLKRHREEN